MMIMITESNHDDDYENEIIEYKNKITELISILSKASDILDDEALTDFINEETDDYWVELYQYIDEYLEALRSTIY